MNTGVVDAPPVGLSRPTTGGPDARPCPAINERGEPRESVGIGEELSEPGRSVDASVGAAVPGPELLVVPLVTELWVLEVVFVRVDTVAPLPWEPITPEVVVECAGVVELTCGGGVEAREVVVAGGKKASIAENGGSELEPAPQRQPSISPSLTCVDPAPEREKVNPRAPAAARKYTQ